MGNNSSSKTRVNSLMANYVQEDCKRFIDLLNLMNDGYRKDRWRDQDIGTIEAIYYDGSALKEKSLAPTKSRLIWLIENLNQANAGRVLPENKTTKKRNELISGEKRTVLEATNNILAHDETAGFPHKWWVLESNSQPDIFVQTDKFIFIGEAKQTENALTKSTNLDTDRIQMVRQIEGAMKYEQENYNGVNEREIISFYILSDAFLNIDANLDDLANSQSGDASMWDNSLKHLSRQSIKEIKETYLGFTTWEEIAETLSFNFDDAR